MKTQTSPIDPELSQNSSMNKVKTSQKRRPQSESAKVARREANRTYRWKNEDQLREKARVRMAARRQAIKESGQLSDEGAALIKQAHAKYRAKNQDYLRFKARLRRQEAFIANHGIEAHRKRIAEERARDDAA
ncbi:hypothetical protein DFH08DRAFT_1088334 [Mycena albidolilacea]|uniref:Uncharacterized protein n=1 Tax=Mycena albidolilacea TaxID=1033008 RepID=A0AAD6Z6F4_9AGAR|nr:hypothetical protein DFH08DRAFT_1088334 [Mycena albidolilacea]